MAKEKRANDGELTKEEMLPLDEEAQAALLDENEALKADCEAAQEKLAQAQTELQGEGAVFAADGGIRQFQTAHST